MAIERVIPELGDNWAAPGRFGVCVECRNRFEPEFKKQFFCEPCRAEAQEKAFAEGWLVGLEVRIAAGKKGVETRRANRERMQEAV